MCFFLLPPTFYEAVYIFLCTRDCFHLHCVLIWRWCWNCTAYPLRHIPLASDLRWNPSGACYLACRFYTDLFTTGCLLNSGGRVYGPRPAENIFLTIQWSGDPRIQLRWFLGKGQMDFTSCARTLGHNRQVLGYFRSHSNVIFLIF